MSAVNENLAALMTVIEEYQDKMPEGEYLKAMNALGALHREMPAAAPVGGAAAMHHRPPPSYGESVSLFDVAQLEQRVDRAAWYRVSNEHPEHFGITPEIWMELPQEERDIMLREATECIVNNLERCWINPDPEVCPFIARHAVGCWRLDGRGGVYGDQHWECACGYTGKTKHWQKHEESKRHQDWAKHRTVSQRMITKMKKAVERDEQGELCRYKPLSRTEFGGIRYFPISQERNEWTHPELYANPLHRNPTPTADGVGMTWFVHPRVQRHNSREYLE
jgi:hypothetical protein